MPFLSLLSAATRRVCLAYKRNVYFPSKQSSRENKLGQRHQVPRLSRQVVEIIWWRFWRTGFSGSCSRHPEAEGQRWASPSRWGSRRAWLKPYFRVNNDTTAVAKVTEWIGITFGSLFLGFRGHNPNLRPGTIESRVMNRETRVTSVTLVLSGDYR